MKHQIISNSRSIFFLAITAFLIGACATVEPVSNDTDVVATEQMEVVTGKYQSTVGVKEKFNCYCINGGFITTAEGKRFAVCFDNEIDKVEDCENMTVKGHTVTKSIASEITSPCPAGSISLLSVKSFDCK